MESPQSFVEEINITEIEFYEVVGKGAFGVVSRGKWRDKDVAVKNIETESERKAFITELKQLSRVCHPNIVKLYGACTQHPVCLVMEYAEGGSLYNVLHGTQYQPQYTAAHAMSWALQCARGVEYLHGMSPKALIHRDLKPPNLLLIMGGTVLKICDFGTACDIQTHMTNNKGSAAWMAPEVFEGSNYSEKCDVFSWGIILWEVITRRKPFDEIGGPAFRIMWAVHQGKRPPLIRNLPKALELLMTRSWSSNPVERPSMTEIVRIMSHLFQFFEGAEKPLSYKENHDHSDASNRSPHFTQSTVSGSSTHTVSPPPSHGGTISDTVRQGLERGIPVHVAHQLTNRSTPVVVEKGQQLIVPTIVVEEERGTRGQQSAPPSLAASLENLYSPRTSRSGTPVQADTHKRYSADFSKHDDVNIQPGIAPINRGHRRSGSHGTPYIFLPTTVPEQAPLALNRFLSCDTLMHPQSVCHASTPSTPSIGMSHLRKPGLTHKRIGSDETNRISIATSGHIGQGPFHHVRSYPGVLNLVAGGSIAQSPPTRSVSHPAQSSDPTPVPIRSTSWTTPPRGVPASPNNADINPIGTGQQPAAVSGQGNNPAFNNMMHMVYLSIDHPLQPLAPFPDSPESMAIYEEHCNLMKEYVRERTEMALLVQRKHELIKQCEREELTNQSSSRVADEYQQLSSENESLMMLHRDLKLEVDKIRRSATAVN